MRSLFEAAPVEIARLDPGRPGGSVLLRGEVAQVLGALELPVPLPKSSPSLDAIAVAGIDVEFQPFWSRPVRERHERGRTFVLRDRTGRALVRVNAPGRGSRLDEDLRLRLEQPFHQGLDGPRDVLVRALAVGDEAVIAGRVRYESDPSGLGQLVGGYRELPRIAVIEAIAVFDRAGWDGAGRWHRLPWWRKVLLTIGNR